MGPGIVVGRLQHDGILRTPGERVQAESSAGNSETKDDQHDWEDCHHEDWLRP